MYIYHFLDHFACIAKRRLRFDAFWRPLSSFLVVLRKPWICTLCFDAHFSKFRDFDDFGPFLIEKWTFWTTLRTSNSLLSKSHDISAFSPWTLSQDLLKTLLFWPNFHHLGPQIWGSWERKMTLFALLALHERFACPDGLEDLLKPRKPCPILDPKFWNFCHLPIQGSVKMPFWPYFDPFWALLSLTFGPPKMCLFVSLCPDGPLERPWGP